MNGIGWAVKQLQDGQRVRRAGWSGGMWLCLVSNWNGNFGSPGLSPSWGTLSFVAMRAATEQPVDFMVPWLCSQTDLLAIDWELA